MEFEFKSTVLLTLVPPQMKYLGTPLSKYAQNLCEENDKALVKEIKEELNEMDKYFMFIDRKTQYC